MKAQMRLQSTGGYNRSGIIYEVRIGRGDWSNVPNAGNYGMMAVLLISRLNWKILQKNSQECFMEAECDEHFRDAMQAIERIREGGIHFKKKDVETMVRMTTPDLSTKLKAMVLLGNGGTRA